MPTERKSDRINMINKIFGFSITEQINPGDPVNPVKTFSLCSLPALSSPNGSNGRRQVTLCEKKFLYFAAGPFA